MNKLEDSDLSWQDWFEGEGITVIASEAPPLEIPQPPLPPPVGADWGGQGVCRSCGLWLLRLYDALLYTALGLQLLSLPP